MRIAFITNFVQHYRVGVYEELSRLQSVDFIFDSRGSEWYWPKTLGTSKGEFRSIQLGNIGTGKFRIPLQLPYLLWSRKYDAVIKGIAGRASIFLSFVTCKVLKIPFVLYSGLWGKVNTRFHRFAFPIVRFIYRHSDSHIVYGNHVRDFLLSQGVKGDSIFIARNSVDNDTYSRAITEKEYTDARSAFPSAPIRLLYVGRLTPDKGLNYLIQSLSNPIARDAGLLIIGTGEELEAIKSQCNDIKEADRVRFIGHVPTKNLPPYYAAASALVLPSIITDRFREPWGLVINEAFNQGCPVITTTSVGAAADGFVRDGSNGFVVAERDSAALATAIGRLGSEELRLSLGARARRDVARCTHHQMALACNDAVLYAVAARGKKHLI
ncbi:MAG TPA: glycosyltransferase family 4 protein [Terracidiphilus sp.]|nr:glycosyltransferase family 4 protein [Terracidiphilus sp.]